MTDVQQPVDETKPTSATETGLVAAPNAMSAPSVPTAAIIGEAEIGEKKDTVEHATAPASASNITSTHADQAAPVVGTAAESPSNKKDVTEGVLGYKAPGLVKSLIYSKKFFWIGDHAVSLTDLHQYVRGEKPEVAHHNAAWSSQTGRGLLYFSKHKDHRQTPSGVINLADISELSKEGATEFHFKLHGQKHSFQAATQAERDVWIASLENAAAEAKATSAAIMGGSGYKEVSERLGKTATGALPVTTKADSSAPKKSTDKAPGTIKRDDTSSSSSSSGAGTKRNKRKQSRSASRKRGSIFGSLIGKKEEHDEKKAEKTDVKPATPIGTEAKTEEAPLMTTAETPAIAAAKETLTTEAPFDPVAVAARVVAQPVVPIEESQTLPLVKDEPVVAQPVSQPVSTEHTAPAAVRDAPKPNKRNSFFGSFFQRKDTASPVEEKKEREMVPPVPVKDNEVPTTTPAIQPPVAADTSVPATAEAPHTTPKDTKEGFFGKFLKQEKAKPATADVSATGPSSTERTEGISPGETGNGPHATKERRRSSFFGTLGTRRERKPEVASETEHSEGETKQKTTSTSPLPRLGSIFRKPSRGAKTHLGTGKDGVKPVEGHSSAENTVAPNQETTPITAGEGTTMNTTGISEPQNNQAANGAIGEVIPATANTAEPAVERTSPEVSTTI
ncbi:MAG: hypothetical protein M1816_008148 [Peltula sp. TS41687]|nr:MAG: hypothetical protein M1816_008148 [Peltula sp. TS41687]